MEKIKISNLLEKYKGWLDNNGIDFLKNTPSEKEKIVELINKLIGEVRPLEEKEKSIAKGLNWYKAHEIGSKLWGKLASGALNHIDKGSKGNKKLFDFLDKATEFEDLLYGLDKHYRDHTLHSLWVYFIGEYILRERLPEELYDNLNWFIFNDIELYEEKYSYPDELINYAKQKKEELGKKVKEYRDAIWCIMALCHDLGYSLEKLEKLNEKVDGVLKFFDIPDFEHVGYSLDIEHQYLVSQFLELMAMDVRIVPSEDYKGIEELKKGKDKNEFEKRLEEITLIKCYRDDPTYWRLCRAIEKKQHGILGAYLIYKILGIFADTTVCGPAEEWGLEDEEVVENVVRGDILFAIAQHTFDFAHLYELNSLADILILADELEEFSRYGRQLLSREYHDTMAWSSVDFKIEKKKERRKIKKKKKTVQQEEEEIYITINILYNVDEEHNLVEFFVRKAQNLCKFYSLDPREDRLVYRPVFYKIKKIKLIAKQYEYGLEFSFCKGPEHTLRIEKKDLTGDTVLEHKLTCHDDKLICSKEDEELLELLNDTLPQDGNKIISIKTKHGENN